MKRFILEYSDFIVICISVVTILILLLFAGGCVQIIVTKPDETKYKINTLLQDIDLGKFQTEKFLLEDVSENTTKIKAKVNPLTNTYEAEVGGDD